MTNIRQNVFLSDSRRICQPSIDIVGYFFGIVKITIQCQKTFEISDLITLLISVRESIKYKIKSSNLNFCNKTN